jgi:glycosyltransferase involved in cell wall biosynthesis
VRILIVSDHYPPYIGGAQRQTKVLGRELARRGHEVSVATVWQDTLPAHEQDEGVDVYRLRQLRSAPLVRGKARRRYQPPFPDPVSVVELRRLIRRIRPDVVHSAGWFSFSTAAALRGSSIPLLASARDYGFSCANTTLVHEGTLCSGPSLRKCLSCAGDYYSGPRGWMAAAGVLTSRELLRRRITALHSVSAFVEDMMERDFLDGTRPVLNVIPSFRVEDPAHPDAAVLDALPAERFILFVGAFRRVKGIAVLLEAYARLASAPPLVLIGTPERDSPPIPAGVTTIDGLPHWAVLAAWERSLFGVMPSLSPEPFGSVIHEAMSRGRAVIGTRPGGHSDMIEDGRTGLLVQSGDATALTAAMTRLIDDGEFREALGARALERSHDFTAAAVVPQFEALYERLAAR